MKSILFVLTGVSYLFVAHSFFAYKKHIAAINGIVTTMLMLALSFAETETQMLFTLMWALYVLLFLVVDLISFYSALKKGLHENKLVYWGLFIGFNVVFITFRIVLHFI